MFLNEWWSRKNITQLRQANKAFYQKKNYPREPGFSNYKVFWKEIRQNHSQRKLENGQIVTAHYWRLNLTVYNFTKKYILQFSSRKTALGTEIAPCVRKKRSELKKSNQRKSLSTVPMQKKSAEKTLPSQFSMQFAFFEGSSPPPLHQVSIFTGRENVNVREGNGHFWTRLVQARFIHQTLQRRHVFFLWKKKRKKKKDYGTTNEIYKKTTKKQ